MVLRPWNPESTICPFRARKWPFQAPKTLRSNGRMANFEAKNTLKLGGKNAKRTNGSIFTHVQGGDIFSFGAEIPSKFLFLLTFSLDNYPKIQRTLPY